MEQQDIQLRNLDGFSTRSRDFQLILCCISTPQNPNNLFHKGSLRSPNTHLYTLWHTRAVWSLSRLFHSVQKGCPEKCRAPRGSTCFFGQHSSASAASSGGTGKSAGSSRPATAGTCTPVLSRAKSMSVTAVRVPFTGVSRSPKDDAYVSPIVVPCTSLDSLLAIG